MRLITFIFTLVLTMNVSANTEGMEAVAKKLAEYTHSVSLPKGAKSSPKNINRLPPVSVIISRSMGDDDLLALMELSHQNPKKIGLVIVGLTDETKDIYSTVLEFMDIAKQKDLNPAIYVEPMFAKKHGIKTAPTMIIKDGEKYLIVGGRTDYKTFLKDMESQKEEVVNLGAQGSVVEISERNLMDVIEERIAALDLKQKTKDAVNRYWTKMANRWNLPTVTKDDVRVVDLSVTVTEDIKDDKGVVRFRKGQLINPLNMRKFVNAVIIFDGSKSEQVETAKEMKKQAQEMGLAPVLITTRLSRPDREALGELYGVFEDRVYFLDQAFKDRFDIRSVPSMVVPSGHEVKIIEVAVK